MATFLDLCTIAVIVALSIHLGWLRERVRCLERGGALEVQRDRAAPPLELQAQAAAAATMPPWAAREFADVRNEVRILRVDQSAAEASMRLVAKQAGFTLGAPPTAPDDDCEEQRDTLTMPAPTGPAPKRADEDEGEPTSIHERDPQSYAVRLSPMHPHAPQPRLEWVDQIDVDAGTRLHADEKTPPRRGRSSMVIPVYAAPKVSPEGGDAA